MLRTPWTVRVTNADMLVVRHSTRTVRKRKTQKTVVLEHVMNGNSFYLIQLVSKRKLSIGKVLKDDGLRDWKILENGQEIEVLNSYSVLQRTQVHWPIRLTSAM